MHCRLDIKLGDLLNEMTFEVGSAVPVDHREGVSEGQGRCSTSFHSMLRSACIAPKFFRG